MMDYLKHSKEAEKNGGLADPNEALTYLVPDRVSGNEIIVTPLGKGDMVAAISLNIFPSQFSGLAIDADFVTIILTLAHFNFLFAFKGDKKVFIFVRD